MAREEEKDGIECVAADRAVFFLGDLSKGKRCAALDVDDVGIGVCGQRRKEPAKTLVVVRSLKFG